MAMQSMTLEDLRSVLPMYFRTKLPIFLWGASGSAKSTSCHMFVDDMKKKNPSFGMIDLRASQLDPVDTRGIPSVDKEAGLASWIPFDSFPIEERDGKEGVLLLEEFNSAVPPVQCTFYQLLFDRRIGDYKLPDGCVVWALGNRTEDDGVTFDVPAPNANRFCGHIWVNPTAKDYVENGMDNGIREEVLCFMYWRPELLFSYKSEQSDMAFGTMRTWNYVSELLDAWEEEHGKIDLCKPPALLQTVIKNAVGEGEGIEFIGYLDSHGKTPDIDSLLSDPENGEVPSEMSIMWAVIGGMVCRYKDNRKLAGRILRYAVRCNPEFATVLSMHCLSIDPEFVENPEFMAYSQKFGSII